MIVDREDMNMDLELLDLDLLICANWASSIICTPTLLFTWAAGDEEEKVSQHMTTYQKIKGGCGIITLKCFKDPPYV